MSDKSLYWVTCNVDQTGFGPTRGEVLVVAESEREALDKAPNHPEAKELWDEEKALDQIDGNSTTRCIEENDCDKCRRKIQVREAEFVGEVGVNIEEVIAFLKEFKSGFSPQQDSYADISQTIHYLTAEKGMQD